jgi:hypothetical protein
MKAHRTSGDTAQFILKLGIRLKYVVTFISRPYYPRERTPILIGGWVGSRASMDVLKKRKISSPVEIRTPDRPSVT